MASGSNAFLSSLPEKARAQLDGRLLSKPIHAGEVLYDSESPIIYLIFPTSGIVSLHASLQDGRTVEEAAIGSDGLLGIEYFLGEKATSYRAVVTIGGEACWLAVADFEALIEKYPAVRDMLAAGVRRSISRLRNRVICASAHSASQRMATWLLRAQDKTGAHQFELTQRTLAGLFGLRLATISDASSRLSAAGAIDQTRGMLTIVQRDELENLACECYARMRDGGGSV